MKLTVVDTPHPWSFMRRPPAGRSDANIPLAFRRRGGTWSPQRGAAIPALDERRDQAALARWQDDGGREPPDAALLVT